jgi:eukaryotic-like serine/threonine-protein kinase
MPQTDEIIEFNRAKQFKYVKPLGSGGTGDTHLFKDETTNMLFAIKKYSPKDQRYIDEFYARFVDEIKILFTISHPNIVRIYNYYLYPESKLGYLQMEYIEGNPIDQFVPTGWGKDWETIFSDTISAFRYLETHNVLHRDIRPANILIDNDENVKIIDFGFGKMLKDENDCGESVFLNWPVTECPEEVSLNHIYNHQSEIYFVGKLFYHLLKVDLESFRYKYILEKMIKVAPTDRYESFEKISYDISLGVLGEINFTPYDKTVYQEFANALVGHITNYIDKYQPLNNLSDTLSSLTALIRNSALEKYLQDNRLLVRAFICGNYQYNSKHDIEVSCVTEFYKLITRFDLEKQKMIMDNIYIRLASIKTVIEDDELPF